MRNPLVLLSLLLLTTSISASISACGDGMIDPGPYPACWDPADCPEPYAGCAYPSGQELQTEGICTILCDPAAEPCPPDALGRPVPCVTTADQQYMICLPGGGESESESESA